MINRIKNILIQKGYRLYNLPYQLNIVGLRSNHTNSNSFDDELHVFYKITAGSVQWHYHTYKVTTDPGTFWLNNPLSEKGTAILAQGQFIDAYAIGKHQGKYEALVQVKPVTVIRDYDRDAFLDFNNGKTERGMFGINIHHAKSNGSTKFIDKYSAGCQVFQNAEDFKNFLALCNQHRKLYGNKFTYTLLDFRAVRRITLKRIAIATTLFGSLFFGMMFNPMTTRYDT